MIKTEKNNYTAMTDEQLILRFQEGDVRCFEELVYRYKNQLYNYVYRFVNNRNDAEDIVQETFLRVYKNKHYYKEIAKFSTWIYTIAGNLARTELRQKKRRNQLSLSNMLKDDKEYEIPDKSPAPDKIVDNNITGDIVQNFINNLQPRFKEVIILRDIKGFSYEEICKMLDVPIGTVKSRVNRGRLKLQEDLNNLFDNNIMEN